jgi:hypothetical protein
VLRSRKSQRSSERKWREFAETSTVQLSVVARSGVSLKRQYQPLARLLRAPRAAVRHAVAKWDVRAAVRQARNLRSSPGVIRICWDLDNTLVNSGALLRAGGTLEDAIVQAEPVPNMLDLFAAIRTALPDAEHFILSARMRGVRRETLAWLSRHGLSLADAAICFVPYAQAKPKVWEELAREARLVIVDDLSYNHEQEQVGVYRDLVDVAERIAYLYIGLTEIAEIARDPGAVAAVVTRTARSLAASSVA